MPCFSALLTVALQVIGQGGAQSSPATRAFVVPSTSPSTRRALPELVYEKSLRTGRKITVLCAEITPSQHPKALELFGEQVVLQYNVMLSTARAGADETLCHMSIPWSLLARPSRPEFVDVSLSPNRDIAVITYNDMDFAWATVVRRGKTGEWEEVGDPFRDVDGGEGSIGRACRSVTVSFNPDGTLGIVSTPTSVQGGGSAVPPPISATFNIRDKHARWQVTP
ncbi:MAG: hypothetical protein WBD40_25435 [Tepidisphaeraceae bacterium]